MTVRVTAGPGHHWLCRLRGHVIRGYYSWQPPYGWVRSADRDGTGAVHMEVSAECHRCRRRVPVIRYQQPAPDQELVWIWSGEHSAYWRPDASGYTVYPHVAGVYSRAEAESLTSHCGPEKKIELRPVARDQSARTP